MPALLAVVAVIAVIGVLVDYLVFNRVDRRVRTAATGQVADGCNYVDLPWVEHGGCAKGAHDVASDG